MVCEMAFRARKLSGTLEKRAGVDRRSGKGCNFTTHRRRQSLLRTKTYAMTELLFLPRFGVASVLPRVHTHGQMVVS